jgi:hypothetical protein
MIGKEKIAKHRPHCHWAAVICAICGSFLLFGFFGFKRFCHPIFVISKRLTPKESAESQLAPFRAIPGIEIQIG